MIEDPNDIITEIQTSLLKGDNVESYVNKIHRLLKVVPISLASKFDKGVSLYRTTNHHSFVPLRVDELWFPPAEFASINRANRKGKSMFYCSSDPSCTFLELGIELGQLAVHSKWLTEDTMILHDLGYIQKNFDRAGANRAVPSINQSFEQSNLTSIHEFIHLAFTDPTPNRYPLTAAIAEVFMQGDEFSGIRYPAIKKDANVDNVALLPDFVRKYLKLDSAQVVKVDEINKNDKSIGGEVIADLSKTDSDGSLHWTYRTKGNTLRPGESKAVGVGIHTMQTDGEVLLGGVKYKVKAGYTIQVPIEGPITIRDFQGRQIDQNT
jgi:hypothetical protein